MFDSITATSVVSAMGSWATESGILVPAILALGLVMLLGLATYAFSLIKSARAGKRARKK